MTRGQVAKILSNAYKLGRFPVDASFTDVEGTGYEEYVTRLYGEGITTGVSETLYGVNNPVKRGQLAVFIKRLEEIRPVGSATLTLEDIGFEMGIYANPFSEKSSIYSTNDEEITESNNFGDGSITFIPIKTGTAYVNVFDRNVDLPVDINDDEGAVTYRIDVTNGKYGLKTTLTRLEESAHHPGDLHISGDVEKFHITDTKNNILASSIAGIEKSEEHDYSYTKALFTANTGDYFLHVAYKGIEAYTTYAFSYENSDVAHVVFYGNYVAGDTFNLSSEFLGDIENAKSSDTNIFDVAMPDGEATLTIKKEGKATLTLQFEGYDNPNEYDIEIKKFAEGYVIYGIEF